MRLLSAILLEKISSNTELGCRLCLLPMTWTEAIHCHLQASEYQITLVGDIVSIQLIDIRRHAFFYKKLIPKRDFNTDMACRMSLIQMT